MTLKLQNLPTDTLEQIASYLPQQDVCGSLVRVNKRLKMICSSQISRHIRNIEPSLALIYIEVPRKITDQKLMRILSRFPLSAIVSVPGKPTCKEKFADCLEKYELIEGAFTVPAILAGVVVATVGHTTLIPAANLVTKVVLDRLQGVEDPQTCLGRFLMNIRLIGRISLDDGIPLDSVVFTRRISKSYISTPLINCLRHLSH